MKTNHVLPTLTLWQPWASLLVAGLKTIETRSWSTDVTGPIWIHASKATPQDARELVFDESWFWWAFGKLGVDPERWYEELPKGGIVGSVNICRVCEVRFANEYLHPTKPDEDLWKLSPQEWVFGNYEQGRFAWKTSGPAMFVKPDGGFEKVECAGRQKLWTPSSEVNEMAWALLESAMVSSDEVSV